MSDPNETQTTFRPDEPGADYSAPVSVDPSFSPESFASDSSDDLGFGDDESAATTDDISAPPPKSRGLGGVLLAAVSPVVAQAVAGALLLRQFLDDPAAIAESTRLLGAVGLGALVLAVLLALFVGRRPAARSELDPALAAAIGHSEASDIEAARRAEETAAERDDLRRRLTALATEVSEAARRAHTEAEAARTNALASPAPEGHSDDRVGRLADAAGHLAATARSSAEAARRALAAIESDRAPSAGNDAAGDDPGGADAAGPDGEILEVVESLESIAAETRLLALNAAIEASGVGEEGARFAVVADEVRKLTENARAATKRLGQLVRHLDTRRSNGSSPAASATISAEIVDLSRQAVRGADATAERADEHAREASNLVQAGPSASAPDADTASTGDTLERLAGRLDDALATAGSPRRAGG